MNYSASITIGMILATANAAEEIQLPLGAGKEGQQANMLAAQIPAQAQAQKNELRYEVRNEEGKMVMSLHNASDKDLGIALGAIRVVLKSGTKTKVAFPNQQAADFKVLRHRGGEWTALFAGRVANQPAKAAIPIKP